MNFFILLTNPLWFLVIANDSSSTKPWNDKLSVIITPSSFSNDLYLLKKSMLCPLDASIKIRSYSPVTSVSIASPRIVVILFSKFSFWIFLFANFLWVEP